MPISYVQVVSLQPTQAAARYTLLKCETCTILHKDFSELHISFIKNQKQIYAACENLTEHVISKFKKITTPKSSQRQDINIMKDVDILQPIVENKIGTTFRTKLSQNITCSSSSVVSLGEQNNV